MLSTEHLIGIIVGIICGLLLVAVIIKISRGKFEKCNIDERQRLVRGTGFKLAFFTLMIYDALYALLTEVISKPFITDSAAILLGICLAIEIFAIYCIWNDGYYALNENPKIIIGAFSAIGALNLFGFARNVMEGEFIVDGVIQFPLVSLAAALMLLLIAIITFLKSRQREREEE